MSEERICIGSKEVLLDARGYLAVFAEWDRSVAQHLAVQHNIELTDPHWQVIEALRDFYEQYQLSPSMRPLIKYLQSRCVDEKIGSHYLMSLFPGSPATLAAKIAGLPRPDNCF